MKNFISLLTFLFMTIFTCHAQLDSRVEKLEQLYWGQGAFAEIHTLAESYSDYMELAENPLNECVIDLYKSLSAVRMSLNREETINCLQSLPSAISDILGEASRYEGLALMAQAQYHMGSNPALAVEQGNKALEILQKVCPNSIELASTQAIVGSAYLFNGDGAKSEQLLSSSIELLKACDACDTWINSMTYAYRSGAYVALRKGDAALEDIDKSLEYFKNKEVDRTLFQHMVLIYGMDVYVNTACGLYDNAITVGLSFIETCDNLEMGNIVEYGNTLQNIGGAYLLKKDQKTGLDYYYKAKAHYDKFGYTDSESYKMLIRNIKHYE